MGGVNKRPRMSEQGQGGLIEMVGCSVNAGRRAPTVGPRVVMSELPLSKWQFHPCASVSSACACQAIETVTLVQPAYRKT